MNPTARRALRLAAAALGGLLLTHGISSQASTSPAPAARPYLLVLGSAQDGGVPHAGCHCRRCTAARRDPTRRHLVASLGLVLPQKKEIYVIDATPDLPEQLELLAPAKYGSEPPPERTDRSFLTGVLLTHAHIGHYLGLAHLGFEVMHAPGVAVHTTPRMAAFLRENGPWSQLVRQKEIELKETPPGGTVELGEGVSFTSLAVPHRDEYSDTVAYLIRGPRRTVFYVPDTDRWSTWSKPLTEVLAGVDVALLDGTFYSGDELPGRDVSQIPHPLIKDSMDLLEPLVKAGKLDVRFIHLNHSNPALEPDSEAHSAIEKRGFRVAKEGEEIDL